MIFVFVGFLIYFGYGIWHSSEHQKWQQGADSVPEKQRMYRKDGIHSEKTSQL